MATSRVIGPTDLLSLTLQSLWKEVRKSHYAFAVSHLLPGGLVSEEVFSSFYNEGETESDGLGGFGRFGGAMTVGLDSFGFSRVKGC